MKYRPEIDGLRAVAVCSVLLFHGFPTLLPGGFVGVDIFFVISGYLISGIIIDEAREGRFTVAAFYRRRIRRIFPALIIVVAATLGVGWFILLPDELMNLGKHAVAGGLFSSNILLWRESGYFDSSSELKPLLHLWSLSVEEQFYIFWPIVLALTLHRRGSVQKAIIIISIISMAINLTLAKVDPTGDFYLSPARFWELLVGAWVANFHSRGYVLSKVWGEIVGCVGVVLLALSFSLIDSSKSFPSLFAVLPTLGAALIIAAPPAAKAIKTLLASRLFVWVGLISYPLYLWHWPLLAFLRVLAGKDPSSGYIVAALLISVVLAWFTYHQVERRLRFSSWSFMTPGLALTFVAICGVGGLFLKMGGVPGRISPEMANFVGSQGYTTASLKSDGSCLSRLGIRSPREEICFTNSDKPALLFIGDSHSMALHSAIASGRVKQSAILVYGASCPLFPGLEYTPARVQAWGNNCTEITNHVLALAKELSSIQTIVVANAMPDVGDGVSRYRRGEDSLSNKDAYLMGQGALFKSLSELGKKVVFVYDPPALAHDPRVCVQRISGWKAQPDCARDFSEVNEGRGRYVELTRGLLNEYPAIDNIDPIDLFCGSHACRDRVDQVFLYSDRTHISSAAAARIFYSHLERKF